jgi:hypothetical protein
MANHHVKQDPSPTVFEQCKGYCIGHRQFGQPPLFGKVVAHFAMRQAFQPMSFDFNDGAQTPS